MMNQYVPTSTLGLRDLFNRFGEHCSFLRCSRIERDPLDVNGDGSVEKQEFEQVMKENGQEFNQDQTELFKRKFEQDENKQITYEGRRMHVFLFRSNEFLLL